MWPVKPRCVECFSDAVEWAPASGRAELYSFVVVHQRYPGFEEPYVVATVETPEGVRFKSLGQHRLRGIRDEVALYQIAAKGLVSRFPPLRTP